MNRMDLMLNVMIVIIFNNYQRSIPKVKSCSKHDKILCLARNKNVFVGIYKLLYTNILQVYVTIGSSNSDMT